MSKNASFSLTGWIAEDATKMTSGLDRALQDTGAYGVQEMKAITSKNDASGRLTDSIMFITDKGVSSSVKGDHQEDKIEMPSTDYTLIVGSGAYYAIYRETYSGTHKHWEGHEDFEASMKEWCKLVLGIDPDRSPGEAFEFALILKHIRDNVTAGVPFVLPNKEKILKYCLSQYKVSIEKFLNSKAHKEG